SLSSGFTIFLQRVVLKVDVHDEKTKRKAMKAVSDLPVTLRELERQQTCCNWRH
ncbi:hypothetical protein RJ641_007593, partial [Dillenia turbinata]